MAIYPCKVLTQKIHKTRMFYATIKLVLLYAGRVLRVDLGVFDTPQDVCIEAEVVFFNKRVKGFGVAILGAMDEVFFVEVMHACISFYSRFCNYLYIFIISSRDC